MIEKLNLVDSYTESVDSLTKAEIPSGMKQTALEEINKSSTTIALCAIADALIDWRIKENERSNSI